MVFCRQVTNYADLNQNNVFFLKHRLKFFHILPYSHSSGKDFPICQKNREHWFPIFLEPQLTSSSIVGGTQYRNDLHKVMGNDNNGRDFSSQAGLGTCSTGQRMAHRRLRKPHSSFWKQTGNGFPVLRSPETSKMGHWLSVMQKMHPHHPDE